jgi:Fe-S-cluster containining protein
VTNYDWTKADPTPILALYEQLDRAWEEAAAGYAQTEGRPVACGAGCFDCCTPDGPAAGFEGEVQLLLSPGEAVILYTALQELSEQDWTEITVRASEYALDNKLYRTCPLLAENGFCSVYSARPMICRIHGFPVLGIPEGDYHNCPKNRFTVNFATPNWIRQWSKDVILVKDKV